MPTRPLAVLLLALLLRTAGAEDTDIPRLAIFSPFGAGKDARIFNDEPIEFRAIREDDPRSGFLKGVRFVLYRDGGSPDRTETVLVDSGDEEGMWGGPPSSLRLPPEAKPMEPGRYHLVALKRGWVSAKITITLADFRRIEQEVQHTRDSYRAAFHLRLEDPLETRKAVPVDVYVESAEGAVLAHRKIRLLPTRKRKSVFQTAQKVRLYSGAEEGGAVLPVVPGCRVVLVLDGIRFPYRVPLPPEEESGAGDRKIGKSGR
jgi:hypothetical protein